MSSLYRWQRWNRLSILSRLTRLTDICFFSSMSTESLINFFVMKVTQAIKLRDSHNWDRVGAHAQWISRTSRTWRTVPDMSMSRHKSCQMKLNDFNFPIKHWFFLVQKRINSLLGTVPERTSAVIRGNYVGNVLQVESFSRWIIRRIVHWLQGAPKIFWYVLELKIVFLFFIYQIVDEKTDKI